MGGRGTSCPAHEAPAGWLPQDVLAARAPFGNAAVLVRTHMIPTRRDLAAVGAPLPSEDPLSAAESLCSVTLESLDCSLYFHVQPFRI